MAVGDLRYCFRELSRSCECNFDILRNLDFYAIVYFINVGATPALQVRGINNERQ